MEEKKKIKLEFEQATLWKVLTVVLALGLLVSIVTGGFSGGERAKAVQAPTPTNDGGSQGPQPVIDVDIDDDPMLGDEDAPVTIVSFEDFQCPFCKRSFDQTFPMLKKNYIETGKVRYIYRDFPLPFHTEADEAANAAECAGDQDKFWEMHEMIYKNQQEWAGNSQAISIFKGYAKDIGLDTTKFDSCLDSRKYDSEIQNDMSDGNSYGVSGTPTFFINGISLVGAQPYSEFERVIEQELAQ